MTKPLGQSDSRDFQDNHRTFYGQPIVVRVKDLTWQPPVPEAPPAQDAWVSNLLGEDPSDVPSEDSLLMDVPAPPIDDEPIGTLGQPTPAPEKPKPQPASTTPTYLRHKGESRRDRFTDVILGHSKKVLGLGGMALSLIFFTYWMLVGDTSEPPVEDVDQELFVELGDNSAPAWNPPAATPESETITVESNTPSVPQIASLPTREDRGLSTSAPYSASQTQLPMIGTPEVESENNPVNPAVNPAYLNNPEPASTESSGGYVPSFSPTGNAYPPMGESAPTSGGETLPTGSNLPNFDAGSSDYNTPAEPYVPSYGGGGDASGYSESAASAPQSSAGNASPYPSTNPGADPQNHWMLKEGKLQSTSPGTSGTNGSSMANDGYGSQLPSIQNGAPQGQDYPQIGTPDQNMTAPYYADTQPARSSSTGTMPTGQENSGFSFNPNGGSYGSPAAGQNGVPHSTARLNGNIDGLNSGMGTR